MSLLTKAQSFAVEKKQIESEPDPEMLELAIAYAKHEITATQGAKALEVPVMRFHARVRHALFSGIRTGKITQS